MVTNKKGATNKKGRIDTQPVFILHHYPYRETSLLLDVFSEGHGRFSISARGARRPGSNLRGVLMAFQPILFSWFGNGEVKTLHRAEWQGGVPQLAGTALLCGFYMNELLMKLLPRDDPAPGLFHCYFRSISRLAAMQTQSKQLVEPVLRAFELTLLRELGYGFDLQHEFHVASPIEADKYYAFQAGCGLVPHYSGAVAFLGQCLLDMAAGDFTSERTLQQSKILMRQALAHELNGATLHTRQILLDLQML